MLSSRPFHPRPSWPNVHVLSKALVYGCFFNIYVVSLRGYFCPYFLPQLVLRTKQGPDEYTWALWKLIFQRSMALVHSISLMHLGNSDRSLFIKSVTITWYTHYVHVWHEWVFIVCQWCHLYFLTPTARQQSQTAKILDLLKPQLQFPGYVLYFPTQISEAMA